METRSKLFFWLLLVIIILVSGFKFNQFFIEKDFTLLVNLDCDPAMERCFALDCSSMDDPECDDVPYKKLETWAGNAPSCLLERTCLDFSCPLNDALCSVTYCSSENIESWEKCTEPVIYNEGELLNETISNEYTQ
jgi:hypothetical protein